MIRSEAGRTSGILNPSAIAAKFQLSRHVPAQDLSNQAPYQQETLPYPVVHLVIEHDKSRIVGVVKGKFSTLLHDRGWVFGVKFRPGAYYPFVKSSVSAITDRSIRIADVFGDDGVALEAAIRVCDDEERWIECAEQFLRRRLPERDQT